MKKISLLVFIAFLLSQTGFSVTWKAKEETTLDDFGDPVKLYDYYSYKERDFEIILYYDSRNFNNGVIVFEDSNFDSRDKNSNQTGTKWTNSGSDSSQECVISVKDESNKVASFSVKYKKDNNIVRLELDNKTVLGLVDIFRANDKIKLIAKDKNSTVHNFGTITTLDFAKRMQCIKAHSIKDGECTICHYKLPRISDGDFIKVGGGRFILGNSRYSNNKATEVIVSDFYICNHEVTQSEYEIVMGANPASDYGSGANYPVYNVSWYDAVNYCNKLSQIKGLVEYYTIIGNNVMLNTSANGYRLPTEAEWEYAARGGKKSQGYSYSGSDNLDEVSWHYYNSSNSTHPVKTKKPNELGLYDMTGNLCEWVWDWSSSEYKSETNPVGPSSGSFRVFRGGSWSYFNSDFLSPFYRIIISPDYSNYNLGFRVARSCND